MPDQPTVIQARNRRAALVRHRGLDDPAALAASAELREAKLADHIKRVVDQFPPLNHEQRDRLAILLRGGASA